MSDKLPTTSYIFIDRRKTGRGKSLPNRQRLLRRIKDAIKAAKPQDIDAGGVKSMGGAAGPKGNANPVKVTKASLHEPTFHYARNTGEHDIVLIGNDEWERGDEFPLSGEEEGKGGVGGPGDDGEDDFIAHVSRDEYLNVFFEDCELPDLQETHEKDLPEAKWKPAGFKKDGNPGQLAMIRSFKNAKPRKMVLTAESRRELEKLQEDRAVLVKQVEELSADDEQLIVLQCEIEIIDKQIEYLERKIAGVPSFEKLDLRYRKREKVLVKAAEAVFAMIMDISGSMDEDKKRMARKFFSLQYAFIKRKYPQTDLIFIAHTDEPWEMDEEEFFSTRKSGGTIVSPAYELLHTIIKRDYDAHETNIYLSQGSDGDNWDIDNSEIIPALEESGLLAKLRFMSYAQVGQSFASGYGSVTLWTVLESIMNSTKKVAMVKIDNDTEVFEKFLKIYKKKGTAKK
jgi:uncharacterized sporulation protein YeaH/YhbH (DUF444 family)